MPSSSLAATTRFLEIADRCDRLLRVACRRRVEGGVFVLHGRTVARKGPARIALRNELPRPDRQRGGEQVVRSFRAKPVRLRERLVELPEVPADAAERGRLVDDDLGLRLGDRPADGLRVQHVENDRLRAERPQGLDLLRRRGRPDDLVAGVGQQRHELPAEYA